MNERIRELVLEAGFIHYGEDTGFYNIPVPAFNSRMEKFAELILQDIDQIVDNLYHAMPLEQAAVLLTLDENIKEHFYGVEE